MQLPLLLFKNVNSISADAIGLKAVLDICHFFYTDWIIINKNNTPKEKKNTEKYLKTPKIARYMHLFLFNLEIFPRD